MADTDSESSAPASSVPAMWSPARPEHDGGRLDAGPRVTSRSEGQGPVLGLGLGLGLPTRPPAPRAAARPPRRRGRLAVGWSRVSAARRILISYLALAAIIASVAGVGAALQPHYGALAPLGGIAVDDLRAEPVQSDWAVDLASTLAPGAPAECLRFSAVDVGPSLVAVRAEAALTYGFAEDSICSVVPDGYRARIALLDTDDGTVRWVHDTGADVGGHGSVSISWVSLVAHGSRLLVRSGGTESTVVETLAVSSGQVVSSTGDQPWTDDGRFTASGDVVGIGRRSDDGLSYVYELRSVSALSTVVWSGEGNETATLIALSDRLLIGDEGTQQVRLATGHAEPWGGPVSTSLGYAIHDDVVFAARTNGTGVTTTAAGGFSAVDKTGKVLWSSDLTLRGNYSLARSCLAVTNRRGDRLSCLDYRSGGVVWSRDIGSFTYAGTAIGQRTNDIYTVSTSDTPQVMALDGSTGRERYLSDVPSGSYVVATGRTVGYALAYGISGSRTSIIAFDLSSGRRLWAHASQLQVSIWGGRMIDVGLDGLARRLSE